MDLAKKVTFLLTYLAPLIFASTDGNFELSILHINDFHARFVQTDPYSGTCSKFNETQCIGGLARLLTETQRLLNERPNAIFLNAGDHYLGTLWYNIYRWNATVHFLNKLPHDAMTLGNHDFDDKISGIVPFLKQVNTEVVLANIDDRAEPSIQGLYRKSVIIRRSGIPIGIIGVLTTETPRISRTEKLIFLDEVESVNKEAKILKTKGVEIILVLSHCGLDQDRILAKNCPDIDVIIGGHSHTFLYTGKPPYNDIPEDEYPVVVNQPETNRTVLITQAAAFTRYLGNLSVFFDSNGEIASWQGDPILLEHSIQQDVDLLNELQTWEKSVDALGSKVVGETKTFLNSSCRSSECNLANLITDGMVNAYVNQTKNADYWTYAAISCINVGGIRNDISAGNITYSSVVDVQPFENTWDVIELRGEDLLHVLEEAVTRSFRKHEFYGRGFLHWSGIRVVYNLTQPAFSRVLSAKVRCQDCKNPTFGDIDPNKWYRIVVASFIYAGGDGISTFKDKSRNHQIGGFDRDYLTSYITRISPFEYGLDSRMILLGTWNEES